MAGSFLPSALYAIPAFVPVISAHPNCESFLILILLLVLGLLSHHTYSLASCIGKLYTVKFLFFPNKSILLGPLVILMPILLRTEGHSSVLLPSRSVYCKQIPAFSAPLIYSDTCIVTESLCVGL